MPASIYSDFNSTLKLDSAGNVTIVTDEDAVLQSIRHIMAIVSGERVRSEIGSSLVQMLFRPMTDETASNIRNLIGRDVVRFEPRVTIVELVVTPFPDKNMYEVKLRFRIKDLQRTFSFDTRLRSFA